jgi:hypothetical protein
LGLDFGLFRRRRTDMYFALTFLAFIRSAVILSASTDPAVMSPAIISLALILPVAELFSASRLYRISPISVSTGVIVKTQVPEIQIRSKLIYIYIYTFETIEGTIKNG